MRLSLPAGVGAMAGTKMTDNAVYDPALRVLFNLFPESRRAGVSGLLEGPIKRAGGAIGNVVVLVALAVVLPLTLLPPVTGPRQARAFVIQREIVVAPVGAERGSVPDSPMRDLPGAPSDVP